jgi:hypothetical protein
MVHGSVGDLEIRAAYPRERHGDPDLTRAGLGGLIETRPEDSFSVVFDR